MNSFSPNPKTRNQIANQMIYNIFIWVVWWLQWNQSIKSSTKCFKSQQDNADKADFDLIWWQSNPNLNHLPQNARWFDLWFDCREFLSIKSPITHMMIGNQFPINKWVWLAIFQSSNQIVNNYDYFDYYYLFYTQYGYEFFASEFGGHDSKW